MFPNTQNTLIFFKEVFFNDFSIFHFYLKIEQGESED